MNKLRLNLALQGGGAHGAFTWGVLDRLLEEDGLEIVGISATSAGAMNAAALKTGWVRGGAEGARALLTEFWEEVSVSTALPDPMMNRWLESVGPDPETFSRLVEMSPGYTAVDIAQRLFSPYTFNPANLNPLRPVLDSMIDPDSLDSAKGPRLFINATNVRTGKVKVFRGEAVTIDALLASACLPTLFQAVEIADPDTGAREAFWDGGYMGNPALFPLIYHTDCDDFVIVHINPLHRDEVPHSASEIINRVNEISFNSSLLRELRAIEFVQRLLAEGRIEPGTMKAIRIHSVADDALMNRLGAATKLTPNRALLEQLKDAGRARMDAFLREQAGAIGDSSTVNLREMFN